MAEGKENLKKLLENAITYHSAGELDSAVNVYKKIISEEPANEIANNNIGIIYVIKENYDKAIEHFSNIIVSQPSSVDTYFNLAEAYMLKDDYLSAISVLEKASRLAPKDIQVLKNLAQCYKSVGDFESSLINYRQLISIESDNIDYMYEISEIYYLMENFERAIEYSMKVLNREKNDWRSKGLLADSFFHLKRYDEAVHMMKDLIEENPDKNALREKLSEYFIEQGKFNDALYQFETILSKEPGNIEYLQKYRELKNYIYENGEKAFLSELEATYEEKLKLKAKKYFEREDYKGIIHEFTKELINNSNNLFLLKSIARAYCRLYEYQDASKYYARYIEKDSKDYEIVYEYSTVLNKLGKFSDSKKLMEEGYSGKWKDEQLILQADNMNNLGMLEEAINLLERNQHNAEGVNIFIEIGNLYIKLGNNSAAQNVWNKGTKVFPHENILNWKLTELCYNDGSLRQALKYLKKYIESDQNDFEAFLFLAKIHLGLKKPKDAFQVWGEIIEKRPRSDNDILVKSKVLLYTERIEEGIKQLELVQDEYAEDWHYLFISGLSYLMKEEYDECVNIWESSISKDVDKFENEFFFIVKYFDKEKIQNLYKRWNRYEQKTITA